MKLRSWACCSVLVLAGWLLAGLAQAQALEPTEAQLLRVADAQPPDPGDPRWQTVALPDAQPAPAVWYQLAFTLPADAAQQLPQDAWMLYLPYFYGGGSVWLNGRLVGAVPETTAQTRVRWQRPHLLALPPSLLRSGANRLQLRVAASQAPAAAMLPRLVLGPQSALQAQFDLRLFFVRTVPVITVVVSLMAGLFALYIWLRRPQETLYAIAGLVGVVWALRTTTFVFDMLPAWAWPLWRLMYHASNGGFIILLALFALHLARWQPRWLVRGLVGWWALGPLVYLLGGASSGAEQWVARWWVVGLIPIGVMGVLVAVLAAWRRPSAERALIALVFVLTLLSGVHDTLMAWQSPWLVALLPQWSAHRFFLLHYGANLLLLTMGGLITLRYVRNLRALEESHRTLEVRVAQREGEIAASYARIAALQREQAATDERQRIMQDLHDGLGAQLFTSLLRAERGALDAPQMSGVLRAAIDEMRVALDALGSDDGDFAAAWTDFRFRWDARLREAGLAARWRQELPDAALALPPHSTLQVLRIAQEALTNVLKHARARAVEVTLAWRGGLLQLEVADDGVGLLAPGGAGHGLANMHARAARLGGRLEQLPRPRGCCWRLELPLAQTRDGLPH
ncbi:sensor histidine kinase [Pseudorhodoferax sp.]|uniref:sensor histidine kinase n=1 Tax=Pseudorhodoferax sp. TaxID=1993553 RepID=UPI002DD62336|nr:ATP-binding protein [Pseudorhodoferax sp.]